MNFKLLVFFALLGAAASRTAFKQRFAVRTVHHQIEQDEPLENSTESPLKATPQTTINPNKEASNQSDSKRPPRPNSKRTRFPEDRNATAADPNAKPQHPKPSTLTPPKKQTHQTHQTHHQPNHKGNHKPKKQQKNKPNNKNRSKNKRKSQRKHKEQKNRRKNKQTGKKKPTQVNRKSKKKTKSGVNQFNKSNRPKQASNQG